MSVLRIRLDADLDPTRFAADAELLAYPFEHVIVGRGAPTRAVEAALGDMPSAASLEVLLPAAVVRVVRAKLPRVTGMALRRVLPNLIEDSIVGDVADCHACVLPGIGADGMRDIAVVGREWMQLAQRIVQLRKPRRAVAVSEAQLAPYLPFLWVDGSRGYLRHAQGVLPFRVPGDAQLPAELRLARGWLGDGPVETGGLAADQANAWSSVLGVRLAGAAWHWADAVPVDPSWSLLQYEYGRGVQNGDSPLAEWRWPLGLGAACVVASIVGLDLHWWMQARERGALEERIQADFRTAFPAVTTVVDPIRQAKRQIALAMGGGDEPYFALTAALATALGEPASTSPAVRSLEYRSGSLRARLASGTNAAQVAERARSAGGVEASTETPGQDGAPVIVLRKKA